MPMTDAAPQIAPLSSSDGDGRAAPYVSRARAYLDEHWIRNVPLDELAGVAGVSKFHLARRFTEAVGIPPHTYQNRVRVERAMEMLRDGVSVQDAAVRTGFSDASHLCRHFKRFTGTTPGRYARERPALVAATV
jgi:AraC-like DNA-binding protein